MPTSQFHIKYRYGNISTPIVSPQEVKQRYLFGVPLRSFSGQTLDDAIISELISAAQLEIEKFLDIKMSKTLISESVDFDMNNWRHWGYVKTTYPVVKPFALEGWVGQIKQITYPQGWLSSKVASDNQHFRAVYIVPAGNADGLDSNNVVYSGIIPITGFQGASHVPNYWRVRYCTGYDASSIPLDLIDVVAQFSAMKVLSVVGNVLIGPGVSSKSVSIDGLSQSIGYTAGSGGGVFGQMVKDYAQQLPVKLKALSRYYKGITFTVA